MNIGGHFCLSLDILSDLSDLWVNLMLDPDQQAFIYRLAPASGNHFTAGG